MTDERSRTSKSESHSRMRPVPHGRRFESGKCVQRSPAVSSTALALPTPCGYFAFTPLQSSGPAIAGA